MIEVMKQALEALEGAAHGIWSIRGITPNYISESITSLRQAIAEAEKQEPVAWACWLDSENPETDKPTVVNYEPLAYSKRRPLLYAHPPKREPLTDERWFQSELFKLAVKKRLLSIHTEHVSAPQADPVTKVSWMEGHAKACDISNEAAHGIKENT